MKDSLDRDRSSRQAQRRHRLKALANIALMICVAAGAGSLFKPNGYCPTIAFSAFVACLLLHWIRGRQ